MKKINNKRKFGVLGVSVLSTAFTLTCFTFVTIAWFESVKSVTISYDQVEVDDGVEYTVKYFSMNADSGGYYKGYQNPLNDSSITCNDYTTDFITIPDISAPNTALNGVDLYPDMCHSYAIEVTNVSAKARNASLLLRRFASAWASNVECYDVTDALNPIPIYLSSAINMYSYGVIFNSSTITTIADNFVSRDSSLSLVDKFTQSGIGGVDISTGLSDSVEIPVGEKAVFFFTLEFSNDSSTFYSYYSSSSITIEDVTTTTYNYIKNVNGSSNVFQKMSFTIDSLYIHVDD